MINIPESIVDRQVASIEKFLVGMGIVYSGSDIRKAVLELDAWMLLKKIEVHQRQVLTSSDVSSMFGAASIQIEEYRLRESGVLLSAYDAHKKSLKEVSVWFAERLHVSIGEGGCVGYFRKRRILKHLEGFIRYYLVLFVVYGDKFTK